MVDTQQREDSKALTEGTTQDSSVMKGRLEQVLYGTWRFECGVEESGFSYTHFAPGGRCFQAFTIGTGHQRAFTEGRFELVSPGLLRLDFWKPGTGRPTPPAQPCLLGRDVFVISAPWREFRFVRISPTEVPSWFREPLERKLRETG
jgi:hypothetical protein